VSQELQQLLGRKIHVVQKHGAQFEVHAAERALLLLLPLNAPNELLLAQDAAVNFHAFLNHVLNGAIVHEGVHHAQAVLRLRVQQVIVQVQVQVFQVQIFQVQAHNCS
jgi:hypothetical protein